MKETFSPQTLANRVRMMRSQHKGAFLLVEGSDDKRLYGKFIAAEQCQIFACNGRANVIATLEILLKDSIHGVLAIIDADFDYLEHPTFPLAALPSELHEHLLLTDAHDLECMLLQSPAFEHILLEFGSETKISDFLQQSKLHDLRAWLLDCGRPLGYLRWLSHQQQLALVFENLTFKNFWDEKILKIDIYKMLKVIKNKSMKSDIEESALLQQLKDLLSKDHDPWQVCCGHDLLAVLSLALHKVLGTHNSGELRPEMLQKSLRLAYEYRYFMKTQLYQRLRLWEQHHPGFTLLPPADE